MDRDRIRTFADKVYADAAGAMAAGMACLGTRTGLFRAMAGKGPMRAEEVARASGLQSRYVEEWLAGMTAAGYLAYDPAGKTFSLPDEHAWLLASEESDHYMGGLFLIAPVLLGVVGKVEAAFRDGGGVRLDELGQEGVDALDWLNRGAYGQRLAGQWLKTMPDVVERLEHGATMLDVGCGVGRVAIAIAEAFPACEVTGLDPDASSIARARAAAERAGLRDRIRFVEGTTRTFAGGPFDLIAACDCIHDFAAPQATLKEMRALIKPDGVLFVVEPKAADRLEQNIGSLPTIYYGFSIFHCMSQSLAQGGPGLGTCMGPARTRELLREAGFGSVEPLDIRSATNLFYAARP